MKTELEGMRAQLEEQQKQYDLKKDQFETKEEKNTALKAETQTKTIAEQDLERQDHLTVSAALKTRNNERMDA